jgi:hypothetical protein
VFAQKIIIVRIVLILFKRSLFPSGILADHFDLAGNPADLFYADI